MVRNKTRTGYIILGIMGILMVALGLDLMSTNYTPKILSSIGGAILEGSDEIVGNSEPSAPTPLAIESAISPTRTFRPTEIFSPTTTYTLPAATASFTLTNTLTITPTQTPGAWSACPGIYLSNLRVGDQAYVSFEPPLANRVRRNPNTDAQVLGRIQPGEKVEILDGPACASGWVWWKVSSLEQNLVGWTSEGDQSDYWLIKIED